ncbi:sensor histidine kinase [Clostridium nigeriense]|uniref:sensor histidine kinase n=1 Tax=Clostridium nigeriense TaxID=1805470 RepID=UPI003D34DC9C
MLLDKVLLKNNISWLKDYEVKNLILINEKVLLETIIGKILILINYFVVRKLVNTTGKEFLPNYNTEGPKYIVLLTWIVFTIIVAISVIQIVLKCRVYNKSNIEEYEKRFYKVKVFDRFIKIVINVIFYMVFYQIIFQITMSGIDIKETILVWIIILNTIVTLYLYIGLVKNNLIIKNINLVLDKTIKCLEDGNFTKVIEILNINKSNYAILNGVEFNIMNRAIFDFILISRDIEDREAISNINKIDLITNVSHDLRTPLTSVINYVDFLSKEDINAKNRKEYINILERKANRISILLKDLKESIIANSETVILEIKEIDLIEVLNQALLEVKEKLLEKELNINIKIYINSKESSIEEKKRIIVSGDYNKILRIYQNLISNIIKYAIRPSDVFIIIEYDESKVNKKSKVIFINKVEENISIDAERLVERFKRGDVSRSTEGSGLGLDIARGLAEAQGGDLSIELKDSMFIVNICI